MRCCRGTFVFCPNKRSVEVQYNNLELGSVFDVLQPSFIPSNQDIKINISPGKKKNKGFEDLWITSFWRAFHRCLPERHPMNLLKTF